MNNKTKRPRRQVSENVAARSPLTSTNWGSANKVRLLLGTVCFVAGAAMMVIEITGIRLLAPIFGNSLYTWTALIGVVLIAFSVGGYLGGWLADRSPQMSTLGSLMLVSALFTALIPVVHIAIGQSMNNLGLIEGPVLLSLILFTVPGCLLGTVSPFTVRLLSRHTDGQWIGAAAGLAGMAGSLGSFIGTFATGFFLIPRFPVTQIFVVTAMLILVLSIVLAVSFRAWPNRIASIVVMPIMLAIGIFLAQYTEPKTNNTLFQKQTYYHQITVFDQLFGLHDTRRYLKLDTTIEGGQEINTGNLTVAYQQYWRLAELLEAGVSRALFLGAGAFGMPEHVAARWPDAIVDVVEIDPAVIDVGYEYFGLEKYPNIEAHAVDARRFINTTSNTYDYIFGDAYNGLRYIPAHLTTREFFQTISARLNPGGIFMMNIVSSVTGEHADLFRAIHATIAAVFPHVEVFSTAPSNPRQTSNILVLAADRDLSIFHQDRPSGSYLARLIRGYLPPSAYQYRRTTILSDQHNPIEYIVAEQLGK